MKKVTQQTIEIDILPKAIITINGVTLFHGFKITTNP